MTDDRLADIVRSAPVRSDGTVDLFQLFDCGFCDGPRITVRFDDRTVSREQAARMTESIASLTREDRTAFEPALWAFYAQEIADGLGNFDTTQEQLDWEVSMDPAKTFAGAVPATKPLDVWGLIRCSLMFLVMRDGELRAQIGGQAAWDGEHGCTFTFDENGSLLKVGPW